jgi:phosphatidylglycerophosphatase A
MLGLKLMPRNPIRRHIFAHWFGCGLSPIAPGTVGSFGAIPLHLVLVRLSPIPHAIIVLLLTGVGFVVSQSAAIAAGQRDPSSVVIDEVAGTLIACWFVRDRGLLGVALAFALFRLLDITKPWLIDRAQQIGPPGVSIMLDDILAGLVAGVVSFFVAFWL